MRCLRSCAALLSHASPMATWTDRNRRASSRSSHVVRRLDRFALAHILEAHLAASAAKNQRVKAKQTKLSYTRKNEVRELHFGGEVEVDPGLVRSLRR